MGRRRHRCSVANTEAKTVGKRPPADFGKIRRRHGCGVANTEAKAVPPHRRCDQQKAVTGASLPIPAKSAGGTVTVL